METWMVGGLLTGNEVAQPALDIMLLQRSHHLQATSYGMGCMLASTSSTTYQAAVFRYSSFQ